MAITPCAASRALQAATSPEAMSLRPVQACAGRLGAAVLGPFSLSPAAGGGRTCGPAKPVPRCDSVATPRAALVASNKRRRLMNVFQENNDVCRLWMQ
jgi:hypothetical protein